MHRIEVVDSHTAGEPTRVVLSGVPDLGDGNLAERLVRFRRDFDPFRSAIVNEPRGSDVLVGALLQTPTNPTSVAGVLFFNNVGFLGMCGHGTIGVVATLAHLGKIQPGRHTLETPVGDIRADLRSDGSVAIQNVPSFRKAKNVAVDVPGLGVVQGDVAWGGNWFFLVDAHDLDLSLTNVDSLLDLAWRIRVAVNRQGYPEVDHVELFGKPRRASSDSRNFVLCPGRAYDRSPCGTGTSAKLACLAADGKLDEDRPWIQESILGTEFVGSYRWADREAKSIYPTILGRAHITGQATLLLSEDDPFRWGIRS